MINVKMKLLVSSRKTDILRLGHKAKKMNKYDTGVGCGENRNCASNSWFHSASNA